jgi:hypothetical protein
MRTKVLCIVTAVSASQITRQDVLLAVDTLVAALMALPGLSGQLWTKVVEPQLRWLVSPLSST